MKSYAKRRGFTLVELLIVIVVIGILSAMMMLSSTEAVSSAKAAKIINNLRNLKTAALAWYVDNLDYVEGRVKIDGQSFKNLNDERAKILKYLGGNEEVDDRYQFSNGSNLIDGQTQADSMSWYIWYRIGDSSDWSKQVEDKKVLEKLAKRGSSVKLRYTRSPNDWQPSGGYYTDSSKYQWGIGLHIFGKNLHGEPAN